MGLQDLAASLTADADRHPHASVTVPRWLELDGPVSGFVGVCYGGHNYGGTTVPRVFASTHHDRRADADARRERLTFRGLAYDVTVHANRQPGRLWSDTDHRNATLYAHRLDDAPRFRDPSDAARRALLTAILGALDAADLEPAGRVWIAGGLYADARSHAWRTGEDLNTARQAIQKANAEHYAATARVGEAAAALAAAHLEPATR